MISFLDIVLLIVSPIQHRSHKSSAHSHPAHVKVIPSLPTGMIRNIQRHPASQNPREHVWCREGPREPEVHQRLSVFGFSSTAAVMLTCALHQSTNLQVIRPVLHMEAVEDT